MVRVVCDLDNKEEWCVLLSDWYVSEEWCVLYVTGMLKEEWYMLYGNRYISEEWYMLCVTEIFKRSGACFKRPVCFRGVVHVVCDWDI